MMNVPVSDLTIQNFEEKTLGYLHNTCNWRVRENQVSFSCLAYNFFGFSIYCSIYI